MQASPEIPTEEKWSAGFLYWSPVKDGNYYAHPLPWMPIVDCSTLKAGCRPTSLKPKALDPNP